MTQWLVDVSGEIDSVLAARGITVPITLPAYFKDRLDLLTAVGTAALTARAAFPDQAGAGQAALFGLYNEWYVRGLKALQDGTGIPDDPGVIGSASGYVAPSTYLTRNPDTEEEIGIVAEPFFTRGKVF